MSMGWPVCGFAPTICAFCDTLGIARPIVYGHSMGGIVAMIYGARHRGHAAALILQSTFARFDLTCLVDGFRRFAGDAVAGLAERAGPALGARRSFRDAGGGGRSVRRRQRSVAVLPSPERQRTPVHHIGIRAYDGILASGGCRARGRRPFVTAEPAPR